LRSPLAAAAPPAGSEVRADSQARAKHDEPRDICPRDIKQVVAGERASDGDPEKGAVEAQTTHRAKYDLFGIGHF
jgi:hypothetical protein